LDGNLRELYYYENIYAGQKWWEDMKNRMKNKTDIQKDLDRKLIEEIGNPIKKPKINFSEIKKLVERGATIDHWVETDGGRENAVLLAGWNGSDEATETICYLIQKFDFIKTEEEGDYGSPLGRSIYNGYSKRTKSILETKTAKDPIYVFLRRATWRQTEDEKLELLEEIQKSYNFSKLIKEDLKKIKDEGQFNDSRVRQNLPILFKFCKTKNVELEECFGKSYNITNPIGWRFKSGNKHHWVAEEIQKTFKNGKVSIENLQNQIKVLFNFICFQINLFFRQQVLAGKSNVTTNQARTNQKSMWRFFFKPKFKMVKKLKLILTNFWELAANHW